MVLNTKKLIIDSCCVLPVLAYPASLACVGISCVLFTATTIVYIGRYFSASAKASVQGYAAAVNISNAANGTSGETTATSLPIAAFLALFSISVFCLTCGVLCGSITWRENDDEKDGGLGVWCKVCV